MARRHSLLLGSTALTLLSLGFLAAPAAALNECGVVAPGGTATCNATSYPTGIQYQVNNLTLNAGNAAGQMGAVTISTVGNFLPGIQNGNGTSTTGTLSICATGDITITTNGSNSPGITARPHLYNMVPAGDATVVTNANITTFGFGSSGISAATQTIGATASITSTGVIITHDNQASGISAFGGNVFADISGTIHTYGVSAANGIVVNAGFGTSDVTVSATVTTEGTRSHAVNLSTNGDGVFEISGDLTTHGGGSNAIYWQSQSGYQSMTVSGHLTTTGGSGFIGNYSQGIWFRGFGLDLDLTLTNTSTISTSADSAHGVQLDHPYYSATATLNGGITTSGDGAHGLVAYAFTGHSDLTIAMGAMGTIVTAGAAAHAIFGYNGCYNYNNMYIDGCADQSVTLSGDLTTPGAGSFGVLLVGTVDSYGDRTYANLTITGDGDIMGGAGMGGGINLRVPDAVLRNSGRIEAVSDLAILAGDGDLDAESDGRVVGRMSLGGGTDSFDNLADGLWYARSGNSDFGDGMDELTNAGLISVIGTQSWFGLESFSNSGRLSLQETDSGVFEPMATTFETLTISGDFIGGGTLALDTFLGSDGSPSDILVIEGTVSGMTQVQIANAGGLGAATLGSGILVIDVSDGTTQAGDFELADAVMQGGFVYQLVLEGTDQPGGQWYLQSQVAAAPMMTQYLAPQIVAMSGWHLSVASLHERLGEVRDLLEGPRPQSAALGASDLQEASRIGGYGGASPEGAWMRAYGASLELSPDNSATIGQQSAGLQMGYDLGWREAFAGGDLLMLGAFVGASSHKGDLAASDAEVDLFGPQAGLSATYLVGGWHADLVVKGDWLSTHLTAPSSGTDDSGSLATLGTSLEVGYRAAMGGFYIEPQAQLSYAHVWADDLRDGGGTLIELGDSNSLLGRLGGRIGGETALAGWQIKPYVEAQAYMEFLGAAEVTITGITTTADQGGVFGSVGGGFETQADGGHLSFYVDVDYLFGENVEGVTGTLGARLSW